MNGTELIAHERQRQIDREGYTPDHDDQHTMDELLEAARCYLWAAEAVQYPKRCATYDGGYRPGEGVLANWPFEAGAWKPATDPIRCLAKAGALIAAEIDRLQRAKDAAPLESKL